MTVLEQRALIKQREDVRRAVVSCVGLRDDNEVVLIGAHLTGSYLWVADRNEYWFEVHYIWNAEHPAHNPEVRYSRGWGHVFPDLAEFDRITKSEDHIDSWGFRHAESACMALDGKY